MCTHVPRRRRAIAQYLVFLFLYGGCFFCVAEATNTQLSRYCDHVQGTVYRATELQSGAIVAFKIYKAKLGKKKDDVEWPVRKSKQIPLATKILLKDTDGLRRPPFYAGLRRPPLDF